MKKLIEIIRHWRSDYVILYLQPPEIRAKNRLLRHLKSILGEPRIIEDIWIWKDGDDVFKVSYFTLEDFIENELWVYYGLSRNECATDQSPNQVINRARMWKTGEKRTP